MQFSHIHKTIIAALVSLYSNINSISLTCALDKITSWVWNTVSNGCLCVWRLLEPRSMCIIQPLPLTNLKKQLYSIKALILWMYGQVENLSGNQSSMAGLARFAPVSWSPPFWLVISLVAHGYKSTILVCVVSFTHSWSSVIRLKYMSFVDTLVSFSRFQSEIDSWWVNFLMQS